MENERLSQIATCWSMVRNANDVEDSGRLDAQAQLLEIYSPSIKRYLLASLKDPVAVDEVYQNFALKLVRGDLKSADPQKGKFRSFVKTTLYRLMVDYHRANKRNRLAKEIVSDSQDCAFPVSEEIDIEFHEHWRAGPT